MSNYGFLLDEGERIEAFLSRLSAGAPSGWRPSRVIFRNFWFFHKEEFIWHHGRLFLGGQNAAGKSTVLSMVVPILLDGNKAEDRLNTFGGHGRHMSYYVTGSATADDNSEAAYFYPMRTSYMALEFCRTQPGTGAPQYLTFGQGLYHDRNSDDKTVRSWGFAILDGRRIGRDQFDLIRDNGLSLSKADLKKLLGDGGEVYDTNLEYKKAVNRLIFGFKDLRDFDALIDLLLQIRRPKLTKEVRPKDVAEILTQSLPMLDDAVMQVTAASLDHIDQAMENIERIDLQIRAAEELEKATQAVFRRMAEGAAAQYLRDRKAADSLHETLREKEVALAAAHSALSQATLTLTDCEQRQAQLKEERASLESEDAFRAAESLAALTRELQEKTDKLGGLRTHIRLLGDKIRRLTSQRDAQVDEWQTERGEALELIEATGASADAARWEGALAWAESLREQWEALLPTRPHANLPDDVPRHAAADGAAQRLDLAGKVRRQLVNRDEKHAAWTRARTKEDEARERFLAADRALSQAVAAVESGRQAAAQAMFTWDRQPRQLRLPADTIQQMADGLAAYQHGPDKQPRDVLLLAAPHREAAVAAALQAAAGATLRADESERRLALLREQRQALDQAPPEPERTPEQLLARRHLAEAAIPFAPLYETLSLSDGADPAHVALVEQAFTAMGLLDALLVADDDRARALATLADHGLSDRLLVPAAPLAADAPWAAMLRPESDHALTDVAAQFLADARGALHVEANGVWQHGVLTGTTGRPAPARFIGRTARERYRLAEIARLEGEIKVEAAARDRALAEAQAHRNLADALQAEWNTLERLPELDTLLRLCLDAEQRRTTVAAEQTALQRSQQATGIARAAWDEEEARLLELQGEFPPSRGLDLEGLRLLEQATREVQSSFARLHDAARNLVKQQRSIEQTGEQIESESAQQEEKEAQADELAVALSTLEGRARALRQLVDSPDAKVLFARMAQIDDDLAKLHALQIQANRAQAVAENAELGLAGELPARRAEAEAAEAQAANGRARLQAAVSVYPTLQQHEEAARDDEGARKVARTLLARFGDRPSLVADIQELEVGDRSALSKTFEEHRHTLRHWFPEHLPSERGARLVQFAVDGQTLTPHGLLRHLEEQALLLRNVLQSHEADLFERHLLQDVGREVRRCLLKAEDWVRDINEKLENHPLRNNEYVHLEWEAKRSDHELGSNIARHIQLIRRDEASLTETQRDTLKGAFQDEIRQIREQSKRGEWRADVFREKLQQVLDYRIWFRFRIFVEGSVGGRQEITDTVFNARSGSERSLVLLFPLIAALSVRYDAAAPDAPRLLALDEGFAGIDAVNGRQMIRFLTSLALTWVVSSEKPPALTEDLAGASIYNMLRAGTIVAARPFFWDGHELADETWEAHTHAQD